MLVIQSKDSYAAIVSVVAWGFIVIICREVIPFIWSAESLPFWLRLIDFCCDGRPVAKFVEWWPVHMMLQTFVHSAVPLIGRRSPDSHPYSTRAALAIWWIAVRFHDAITNIAKINVVWQNQQWSKMYECLISNRFDCRWEKQSLQRRTSIESIPFNVFQRIEQWNEAKGNTTFKSTPFNLLDFVIHDDRHEVNIIVECLLWHCYRR